VILDPYAAPPATPEDPHSVRDVATVARRCEDHDRDLYTNDGVCRDCTAALMKRIGELEGLLGLLRGARPDVLRVVLDGDPGQKKLPKHWAGALAINNSKKAAVVKGKPRIVEFGAVKRAKETAAKIVWDAVSTSPQLADTISKAGMLEVEIDSYWPSRRHLPRVEDLPKGDVDAPLKLTIDLLELAHLIDEDARVVEVRARKFVDARRPRIELRVMPCLGRVAAQGRLDLGAGGGT